jgi:hypothetical protein
LIHGHDLELFERSLRHATETSSGKALDAVLQELGWRDALRVDPRAAISTLFECQGAANVTSSALAHVVGSTVLPALGQWHAPGVLDADRLTVSGLAAGPLDDSALVVARVGDTHVAHSVRTGDLRVRQVRGLDPSLGLSEVSGGGASTEAGPVDWPAAVAVAQRAIGHELVGAARKMLDLAREHALERIQFGVPISTFQAVRHRLADTLVAIETADAALDAAWHDRSPVSSAMAKALAGRGARTAARHCQQVLAGIGFTTEHVLHHYLRRVLVLDQLFGSARTLTRDLGAEVLSTRQLPPVAPL